MAIYYIDLATRDDTTGDGSAGNPYKTIDKAISLAGGPHDIRVSKTTAAGAVVGSTTFGWTYNSETVTTSTDLSGTLSVNDIIGKPTASGNGATETFYKISAISSSSSLSSESSLEYSSSSSLSTLSSQSSYSSISSYSSLSESSESSSSLSSSSSMSSSSTSTSNSTFVYTTSSSSYSSYSSTSSVSSFSSESSTEQYRLAAARYRFSGYKPLLLQLDMTGPAYIVVRPHPYYSTQPDYWDHPSYGNPGPPSQPRSPLDGDDLYPLLPID